jgi:low affinity Fe/Cu permease
METLQNLDPWVIIAIAVGLSVVTGVLVVMSQKRKWDYSKAEAMRAKVEKELPELRKREASALDIEAQADRTRAEAERLEERAREWISEVEEQRNALNEQLRAADERDPFVDNDVEHRHVDDSARRD